MLQISTKQVLVYFATVFTLMMGSIAEASAQCTINPRIRNVTAPVSGRIINFMEYVPLGYDPLGSTRYPVIINWSGREQIGGTFCDLLSNGLPKVVNDGNFPATVSNGTTNFSYIVIAPQITDIYNNANPVDNVAEANAMITYLLNHYKIDPTRIYMTGFSWGSYLIMEHVTSSVANGSKVAALAPVANCYTNTNPDFPTRVSNIVSAGTELWGLQCPGDPVCSTSWIQGWVNSINDAAPGRAVFTPVNACTGNHYAWDLVYNPAFEDASGRNIYEWMIQFASNFALPANVKNYSARLNNGKVTVEWTTTSESNSDHFILERASADMDFKPVNTISAAGNSSTEKKYSLTDDQPLKGANFYRLALVNRDSKKEYYGVKKISLPSRFSGMVNIPNPAKGSLSVYLDIPSRQVVTIGVYDLNGKLLKQLRKEFSPGVSENRVDVSALAKGTYFVRVDGETVSTSKKVLIN